jgi:hypothetical protein
MLNNLYPAYIFIAYKKLNQQLFNKSTKCIVAHMRNKVIRLEWSMVYFLNQGLKSNLLEWSMVSFLNQGLKSNLFL